VRAREEAKRNLDKAAKAKLIAAKRANLKSRSKEFAVRRKAFYTAANLEGKVTF
jgi:hypothetical protein